MSLKRNRSNCASGKTVGAFLLQWILRRHDEKGIRQLERLFPQRHLPLLHGLKQGTLHLGLERG